MTRLKSNGIELGYDSFGDSAGETMLLISGLGTQRIRWTDAFCESLSARGYRVIRFDNRDAGDSTHFRARPAPDFGVLAAALQAGRRPEVPYTLADMATDTVGLLDALGVGRAHLVGRSMGGMIAQVMACEYPERVLSLTSVMASTGNPALPSAAPDVMALLTRRAPDPAGDEAGFLEHAVAFARRITGPGYPFDEDAVRELVLKDTRRSHDPAGFGRQIAAIAAAGDRRHRLASVAAPTLVIHGIDDPLIPAAAGEDTAASIPGAELMLVEGMGHELPPALYGPVADAIVKIARRGSELRHRR